LLMKSVLASARTTALIGLAVALAVLIFWLLGSGIDRLGLASLIARIIHVFSAILWVGMIWFVNFIQLAAVANSDDAGRSALLKHVVPHVAKTFRHASHLTLLSGAALLVSTGYLFDRWVFNSAVYIPPLKFALIYAAALAALVMWVLVHFLIWPALQIVLGLSEATADQIAAARERVRTCARINLLLALPVTLVMVTAAHI
jgi:uncharacterized membrane protein